MEDFIMNKIFAIVHVYVEGDYEISFMEETLGFFLTEAEANAYVQKWNNPRLYRSEEALRCGQLMVCEINVLDINSKPVLATDEVEPASEEISFTDSGF
jgi:hypothetical protein